MSTILTKIHINKKLVMRSLVSLTVISISVCVYLFVQEIMIEISERHTVQPPGKLISLSDGRKIHINCTGAGSRTIILDAGMGGTSLSYAKVQPEIAKFARVCSYDRAGYAWSDEAPGVRSAQNEADELREILNRADIKPPYTLVGSSWGGFVVRVFAAKYPEDIDAVLEMDPAHEKSEVFEGTDLTSLQAVKEDSRYVNANLSLSLVKSYLGIIRRDYVNSHTRDNPQKKEQMAFLSNPKNFRTMIREWAQLVTEDFYVYEHARFLDSIPVTFLVQKHRLSYSDEFCKLSNNCKVISTGGSDHLIPQNNPIFLASIIKNLETKSNEKE